jgi:hypothetical protein
MCRNIKPLFNFEPPVNDAEIRASALQFVRKVSGYTKPSKSNEAVFNRAVEQVTAVTRELLESLVTDAEPKDREVEAAKAKARAAQRYGTAMMVALFMAVSAVAANAQSAADIQIRSAVSPLPEEFRASATVLGYEAGKTGLQTLRAGTGAYVCLADDPSDAERVHVACYHKGLEPFMARGRELRMQKVANVDSVRFAEIDAKKLVMPTSPSALYSLTGKPEHVAADGAITGARELYVIYIPFATAESTGLPTKGEQNKPWIMFPGTAKAHIMFIPRMN